MKKSVQVFVLVLAMVCLFTVFVSASGMYYDYFEVSSNSKARNINTAISKIDKIKDVNYSSRFSVYSAEEAYENLSDKEKPYVVNFDKLDKSTKLLKAIGDLNSDGLCNANDLVLLKNHIMSDSEVSGKADINEDSAFNILDLIAIKKLVLGI